MNMSPQINELAAALSKAQGEMKGAQKDAANPFFKSKYADLSSVVDAIREPFLNHGLSFTQTTRITEGGHMVLQTYLLHSSGQWMAADYPVKPVKDDPQGLGSALTYARRYSLQAISGVPSIDDDGEAAMNRTAAPIQRPVQQARPTQATNIAQQPQAVRPVQVRPQTKPTFDEMDGPPGYMK